MAIERVVKCDGVGCGCVIKPDTGFVVLGNIHKVGTQKQHVSGFECVGGGLIGNSLEETEVVKAMYYCDECMPKALGITVSPVVTLLREGHLVGSP